MNRTKTSILLILALTVTVCSTAWASGCKSNGQAVAEETVTEAVSDENAEQPPEEGATNEEPADEQAVAQATDEESETPTLTDTTAASAQTRDMEPAVDATAMSTLVNGNLAFGFSLYQTLRGEEGNLFFSPYSISTALAMTYAGASANTETQMATAMHFTLDQASLHPAFNALELALNSRGETPEGAPTEEGDRFDLNVINAIWAQQGFDFLPEFLAVQAESYGAAINLVDFASATEVARVRINTWVSEQTNGKIEELLAEGILTSLTRMVLTNAIYFTASWADAFDVEATQNAPFHLLDGSEVPVPMMAQTSRYGYANGDGFVAVDMPYYGNQLAMTVMLPDEGQFEAFEASFSGDRVAEVLGMMGRQRIALKLPRFTFRTALGLNDALEAMGMPDAFSEEVADFTGMTGARDLYISAVVHQAFVAVDETGTEAAAATAVVMSLRTASPSGPPRVIVDRPFIFFIRDIETGTILFMGRVLNPAA